MNWLEIPSCPGYEASPSGEIRRNGQVLRFHFTHDGYKKVTVNNKSICVHLLICRAFHGEKPSPKHEVRHLDGTKTNNSASNLCWGTRAENYADRKRHKTDNLGSRHGLAKLNENIVREIRAQKGKLFQRELAKKYGVSKSQICNILNNQQWKHV